MGSLGAALRSALHIVTNDAPGSLDMAFMASSNSAIWSRTGGAEHATRTGENHDRDTGRLGGNPGTLQRTAAVTCSQRHVPAAATLLAG
jgi:hypothetical protein